MPNLLLTLHVPDTLRFRLPVLYKLLLPALLTAVPVSALAADSLDRAAQQRIVSAVGTLLENHYVFAETGKRASQTLQQRQQAGHYAQQVTADQLARAISDDLVTLTGDHHFQFFHDPERARALTGTANASATEVLSDAEIEDARSQNFGLREARVLDGNIGYIKLDAFYDLPLAAEAITAAMALVTHTDALILDLRRNHGGSSDTARFLVSYAFDAGETRLFDMHSRESGVDQHQPYQTLPYLPGPRRPARKTYILTSNYTFSAAESVAYSLQSHKKGIVVGEASGGGAHMWSPYVAADHFVLHLPTSRPVDAITGGNWEGAGVKPDIPASPESALLTAHRVALETLVAERGQVQRYLWPIPALRAQESPVTLSAAQMARFVGEYQDQRTVTGEANQLFYQRDNGIRYRLLPLQENLFALVGAPEVRIEFLETQKQISALRVLYDDGSAKEFTRQRQ